MRVPLQKANTPARTRAETAQMQGEDLIPAVAEALARPPAVEISPHFAARVAQRAVADRHSTRGRWLGWGPRLAIGSGVVLVSALFAVAPHAAPSLHNGWFDAELAMLAELSTLLLFSHHLLHRR